ncbi:unnamed protein product [Ceratitis capitata]|uniref:(Mediterranean fruit fly) hypothetical protein n=1 Tax=Ceratitis capitata TaxID=7213 RepID=A0A811TXU9_CERCA|nr:unnamed protein product [Ceratitis capitata]
MPICVCVGADECRLVWLPVHPTHQRVRFENMLIHDMANFLHIYAYIPLPIVTSKRKLKYSLVDIQSAGSLATGKHLHLDIVHRDVNAYKPASKSAYAPS